MLCLVVWGRPQGSVVPCCVRSTSGYCCALLCEVDLRVLLCLVVWDRPQAGTALFLIIGSPTHPPPLARGYLTHILSWHKQWTGKPCTPIMALILYPLMLQLLWHHLSSLHVCFIFQNQRNSLFIVGNRQNRLDQFILFIYWHEQFPRTGLDQFFYWTWHFFLVWHFKNYSA